MRMNASCHVPYDAAELKHFIEKEIQTLAMPQPPQALYAPICYSLQSGGKRMRPILTLLAYQLFREDVTNVIKPALAVEVFHNFTLVHDDIMDNAPLRRGQPTVHKKWNTNTAILAGDALLLKAVALLGDALHGQSILQDFCDCALRVCEGQQLDLTFEKEALVTEAAYLEMISLKTGTLFGFCLKLGAQLAGATSQTAGRLAALGMLLGSCFQLKDDLLDAYPKDKKFGKKMGGDIVANKKTYLLIKALELANVEQRAGLTQWLQKTDGKEAEKIAAIKAIFDQLRIPMHTENKAQGYFEQASSILKTVEASQAQKAALENFIRSL